MLTRTHLLLKSLLILSLGIIVKGELVPVRSIKSSASTQAPSVANGKIAFGSDGFTNNLNIYLVNPDGSNLTQLTDGGTVYNSWDPAWSPDGTRIAFTSNRLDNAAKIYVMNADGTNVIKLTDTLQPAGDRQPSWSPDGTKIAFLKVSSGYAIYVMNSDGSGQKMLVSNSGGPGYPAWSPDGTKIAFSALGGDRYDHIYVMNADGSNQTQLTSSAASDTEPSWSPDGTKVAFLRIESLGIWTMKADGSNQVQISNGGDTYPAWSPDGQRIAFISSRSSIHDVYIMNTDGSDPVRLTRDQGGLMSFVSWQPLFLSTSQNPTLLTEENSSRAIALNSVTFMRDPFPFNSVNGFSPDQRTRVMLYAMNIDLLPGEDASSVTARAEDSQQRIFPMTVEYVDKVPGFSWLTQVNVRLPDGLSSGGDVLVSLTFHGMDSNQALISIKSSQ